MANNFESRTFSAAYTRERQNLSKSHPYQTPDSSQSTTKDDDNTSFEEISIIIKNLQKRIHQFETKAQSLEQELGVYQLGVSNIGAQLKKKESELLISRMQMSENYNLLKAKKNNELRELETEKTSIITTLQKRLSEADTLIESFITERDWLFRVAYRTKTISVHQQMAFEKFREETDLGKKLKMVEKELCQDAKNKIQMKKRKNEQNELQNIVDPVDDDRTTTIKDLRKKLKLSEKEMQKLKSKVDAHDEEKNDLISQLRARQRRQQEVETELRRVNYENSRLKRQVKRVRLAQGDKERIW
ncbi:uncharacterized protein V2V93DRAFT_366169 [Kockiozyma suomiensis]|uniref:uncharacterized protein n=1 Tax=Kockiozyma suomiensis TaxID=1337062 RepID=UPI0033437DFF